MKKSNYLKKIRKAIFLFFLIILFLCKKSMAYAERENFYEFASYFTQYVTLEDVYDLNKQYIENPELEEEEALKFLAERAEKDGRNIDYADKDGEMKIIFDVMIDDNIGYIAYYLSSESPYSSYIPGKHQLYLVSSINQEYFCLSGPRQELDDFIKENNKVAEKTKFVCDYAENYLEDDEYGGVINRIEDREPAVLLVDESKADMLKKQGIEWEPARKSKADIYEEIRFLWNNREELKIIDAGMNDDRSDGKLHIRGFYSEEEFQEIIQNKNADVEDYIYHQSFDYCNPVEEINNLKSISELDDLYNYLLIQKNNMAYLHYEDTFWTEIKVWLNHMKEIYPEYTYDNLFTLGYISRDISDYIDLEGELTEFVNTISYTENIKNPFEEEKFGDPEHLALGVLLKRYKIMYPGLDYKEIYNEYLKEINESSVLTQEEKRNRYEWNMHKLQREIEKLRKEEDKHAMAAVAVGCIMIAFGVIIMTTIKVKYSK